MIRYLLLVALASSSFAQQDLSEGEQQHLRQVLAGSSTSAIDLIHALETHLAKYPESPKKSELEKGILKAAIQASDAKRIAEYGERVVKQEPDDMAVLDPVCKALVLNGSEEKVKAGLQWSKHYEALVRTAVKEMPADAADRGRQKDDADRFLSHALLYQAIANGVLGEPKVAAELARKSFDIYPAVDSALEMARRLTVLSKVDEAIRAYADAFTITDSRATEADRVEIRRRLGELYQKAKGSEAGLGDIVLQAYDRNAALLAQRRLALKLFDPNLGVTNPMEFTLKAVNGDKLALNSLNGKVVVMDFWATWCGPCRVQHPLYEQVKQRFTANKDVVFLAIATDEDRSLVKPFVDEQGWKNAVYYEDGLARALRVTSIPTTVVFGKNGTVVSRMNGFNPDSFVEVLSDRIQESLEAAAGGKGSQGSAGPQP
jgi:thiol-disulfide isomerase/thioredoxin